MSRSRRARSGDTLLRRFAAMFVRRQSASRYCGVLDRAGFNQCLIKEQARCSRLPGVREFACIRIGFSDVEPQAVSRSMKRLANFLRSELRLFDEIGATDDAITLLLPETGNQGATVVADRISVLADDLGIPLNIVVYLYPDDDPLASIGVDFPKQQEPLPDRVSQNGDSQNGVAGNGSLHFGEFSKNGFHPEDHGSGGRGGSAVLERVRESTALQLHPVKRLEASAFARQYSVGEKSVLLEKWTPVWKRGLDIFGSSIGLVVASPIFLLAAVAIRLESAGPILFRQAREGKDGKVFEILKFRTMKNGAEKMQDSLRRENEQDGPAFKVSTDPRVTRVGLYLRKSCIDEMPQLVNILLGQMSLVGPRPLPVNESRESCSWHRQRLTVLPGLTCLWQISGERDMKFDRWMRLDLEYIRKRSFWFDVKLICQTLLVAIRHRGNT